MGLRLKCPALACATLGLSLGVVSCWSQQQVSLGDTPSGDADADTDGDTDGETDTPTDTEETWQDCGYLDGPCCEYPDRCAPHLAFASIPDCTCLEGCEPAYCESSIGGLYSCIPFHSEFGTGFCSFPEDEEPAECDPYAIPNTCTTHSGLPNGFCMVKSGESYCVVPCDIALDECDDAHHCSPLTNGSGACTPGNWS